MVGGARGWRSMGEEEGEDGWRDLKILKFKRKLCFLNE